MGISTKKARKIIIDGNKYIWRFSNAKRRCRCSRCEDELRQSTSLFIQAKEPDGDLCLLNVVWDRDIPITPAFIRYAVEKCIKSGWDPKARTGKPFRYPEHLETKDANSTYTRAKMVREIMGL